MVNSIKERGEEKVKLLSRKAYVMNRIYQTKGNVKKSSIADGYYNRYKKEFEKTYDKQGMLNIKKWVDKEIDIVYTKCGVQIEKLIELAKRNEKDYEQIKDVKMSDFLQQFPITKSALEGQLQKMELRTMGLPKKSDLIENILMLPPFANHFYLMMYRDGKVPTQEEFKKDYLEYHKEYCEIVIPPSERINLEYRIMRMYPSIVRDVHFYLVVKESNLFEKQGFSLKHDIEGKMDMLVSYKKQSFGLQMRTQTTRSNSFYKKKKKRSPIMVSAVAVDCPFDLFKDAKELQTSGDRLKLYSEEYLLKVIANMEQTYRHFLAVVPQSLRSNETDKKKMVNVYNNLEEEKRTINYFQEQFIKGAKK